MIVSLRQAVTVLALTVATVSSLAGCGDGGAAAQRSAAASCAYPVPATPNFDAQTADPALLAEIADAARERARLADEAATADQRWQALADAARVLSVAADRVLEVRRADGSVGEEIPLEVWDQVKYASDAFLIECRAALVES